MRDRARQAITPSYIPGDRIRWFPQSSLKLLPGRSSREHLNIQFHSFLNMDGGGYLLLSQAFCVGSGGFVEEWWCRGFCVSSSPEQEDDQQESRKCNEWGTSGNAWNALQNPQKPFKLDPNDARFCSQQFLRDLWSKVTTTEDNNDPGVCPTAHCSVFCNWQKSKNTDLSGFGNVWRKWMF